MPAKYIRCEVCGATFSGDAIDHRGNWHKSGYRYGQGAALREEAMAKGWRCDAESDRDFCPQHASEAK